MAIRLIGSAKYRPFRNVWMLEELGVSWRYEPATPRSEAAHKVNPFGKIPTLVDEVLTAALQPESARC